MSTGDDPVSLGLRRVADAHQMVERAHAALLEVLQTPPSVRAVAVVDFRAVAWWGVAPRGPWGLWVDKGNNDPLALYGDPTEEWTLDALTMVCMVDVRTERRTVYILPTQRRTVRSWKP